MGTARVASDTRTTVTFIDGRSARRGPDRLASEEPLEIRVEAGGERRTVAVTMRTPGADFELAAGFLHAEQVLPARRNLERIAYCTDGEQTFNVVTVGLRGGRLPDLGGLDRHFFTSSACGVCGKAALEGLELRGAGTLPPGPSIDALVLAGLPALMRAAQGVFERTGGLHAAGLFDASGALLALREDVGRHNAVDKVVGWALLHDRLPLSEHVLMVSGRSSFEIVQKALAAGIPIVASVSAPSSLAVDTARRFGMTLAGFARGDRLNVYADPGRIQLGGGACG